MYQEKKADLKVCQESKAVMDEKTALRAVAREKTALRAAAREKRNGLEAAGGVVRSDLPPSPGMERVSDR